MNNEHMQPLHPFGHGGDLHTAAKAAGVACSELLDFSASINPLGPPPGLFSFLAERLPDVKDYPDPACRALCRTIRDRYQICDEIVPGNGAGELIYLLMRAVPPGSVLIPAPTFSLYGKAAAAAGREVSCHILQQCDNFALQPASFCDSIRRLRPALAVLCTPNNPTGNVLERDNILQIAETCAKTGTHLLVDEAFLEFCPDWRKRTMLGQAVENVVVLYSLTKMYAIPGLRLGFLTAPPAIADIMRRLRDPWSVSTLAQLAGEYVLQDRDFVRRTVSAVVTLAGGLRDGLQDISGLHVWPPTANYLFMESLHMPSHTLQQRLLFEKVLVRDCGNFTGLDPRFIRVAVRTGEENKQLISALGKILKNGGK